MTLGMVKTVKMRQWVTSSQARQWYNNPTRVQFTGQMSVGSLTAASRQAVSEHKIWSASMGNLGDYEA